jgi:hypothetical protein
LPKLSRVSARTFFQLPQGLARTLSTTNAIEFVKSCLRKKTQNVTK